MERVDTTPQKRGEPARLLPFRRSLAVFSSFSTSWTAALRERAMQNKSDSQLVAQAQSELPYGTSAFNVLVRRHSSHVFQRSFRILRSEPDAQDIVQEVFLSVFRNLRKYEPEKPFLHWLNVITLNACRMMLRKRQAEQRRRTAFQDEHEDLPAEAETDPALRRTINLLLDELQPGTRIPLVMRFVEERSYREIATELELSESAVKMRVSRGAKQLRELWEARQSHTEAKRDGGESSDE